LKWLNVTQALEDIELFVQMVKKQYGTERKILLIGGSYPGAVVSWFKVAHPDSVTAIWSSSGVINAIKNFTMFDYDIYNATS
jgi:serine protease 16